MGEADNIEHLVSEVVDLRKGVEILLHLCKIGYWTLSGYPDNYHQLGGEKKRERERW